MPIFKYEALDSQGVAIKNEIEALSQKEAVSKIRNLGYFPTKVRARGMVRKPAAKAAAKPKRRRGAGGKVKVKREITVKIPSGVDTGSQLRLRGEGEPGEFGGPPGDLFVVIRLEPHDFFTREGDHLLCEVPISFVQAALGAKIEIPVLGHEGGKEFNIPAGTQPGDILTLPGEGMPTLRRNERGDLFTKITVKIPKGLTPRQKEILAEFAELEDSKKSKKAKSLWNKMKM